MFGGIGHRPGLLAVLAVAAAACQGIISEPGDEPGAGGSGAGTSITNGPLATSPRVARLTHTQWENTVRDLFYLPATTGLSSNFPDDPTTGGFIFENNATALSVDSTLWSGYQRATEDLLKIILADASVMAKILPPDGGDDQARARAFIETFGRRAYRRKLTQDEVTAHLAIFDGAASLIPGKSAFDAGVELVLAAMLQSPYFLYRVESSTKASGNVIPLSDDEVASRLSFFLWNSMPDDELFAAADASQLRTETGVEDQARRLLKDPRAEAVVLNFHHAVLELDKYANIKPLQALFPEVPTELPSYALQETELFVNEVFRTGGGFSELLTSTRTFVNADLAKLYGLSGSYDDSFKAADLDPTRRKGIFTQIGFLATNASAADPDPIHRGAYLARRIACLPISAPPNNVPPLPASDGTETNRELVEKHTQAPDTECADCHTEYINPFGFPFENYDAVGAWRDEDNGKPVNAAASPMLDGVPTPVQNAVQLADSMAQSQSVHECYAGNWVKFAFGRPLHARDDATIQSLGGASRSGASLEELLVTLAKSRAFRNRSAEEQP